ncbi:MAG TPA: hypothetical protein VMX94_03095 [Armatimonadota bacterium]|nr:hypothetical protein [Armatimonadota bacterium]
MSSVEKVYILSFYELRLLVRSRRRLLCALCLPLVGGLSVGLARLPLAYGLFVILPISSLFLAAEPGAVQAGDPLPASLLKPSFWHVSRAAAALLTLAIQAGLYTGVAALLGRQSAPGFGILIGALGLSVMVGFLADYLRAP